MTKQRDEPEREQGLAPELQRLKEELTGQAVFINGIEPLARGLDHYVREGLPRARERDPEMADTTLSVYGDLSEWYSQISRGAADLGSRLRMSREFLMSASTIAVNTAIMTGTVAEVYADWAAPLVVLDYEDLNSWADAISSWDRELGEAVSAAIKTMAVTSPRRAALQVREALSDLERTVTPKTEWKDLTHRERWTRAAKKYVRDPDRQRNLVKRAEEAARLHNKLTAAGKATRRGVKPTFDSDETRLLMKGAIRLILDWVMALRESGLEPQGLAAAP